MFLKAVAAAAAIAEIGVDKWPGTKACLCAVEMGWLGGRSVGGRKSLEGGDCGGAAGGACGTGNREEV